MLQNMISKSLLGIALRLASPLSLTFGKKADTVKSLLGLPKTENAIAGNLASPPAATPAPTSIEDKTKKKLNKLLGF
jgi:hypothetical protein